jgi:hypothetical protein
VRKKGNGSIGKNFKEKRKRMIGKAKNERERERERERKLTTKRQRIIREGREEEHRRIFNRK